jgi:hypothetical protein
MPKVAARDELTHGERLLVRTVRLLALNAACEGPRAQFADACGYAGEGAYRALQVFLQQLGLWGHRRLRLSVPGDPQLTPDEALILDVFACAQGDDYLALDAGLMALTDAPPPPTLGEAACWVGQAFAMNGLQLPGRPRRAPTACLWIAAE